jgi:hypothetical protein
MGVSLSWIAINVPKDQALAWMSLQETAEPADPMTAELCGAQIGNWYVACARDLDFAKEENLFNLSRGCEVLGGMAEEFELRSGLVMYKDGSFLWRVEYENGESPEPALNIEGPAPPELAGIENEKRELQKSESADSGYQHLYDAPLDLCFRLCGFHYDPDGARPTFKVLKLVDRPPANDSAGGWFKRMFGR